jgi:subtilisin-like proprotein convertase family protein
MITVNNWKILPIKKRCRGKDEEKMTLNSVTFISDNGEMGVCDWGLNIKDPVPLYIMDREVWPGPSPITRTT